MQERQPITPEMGQKLSEAVVGLTLPISIKWSKGKIDCEEVKKRTVSQNSLLHKNFDEIAKHFGDRTAAEVKGESHLRWGVPIRLRDEKWAWLWERATKDLTYEQRKAVCESGVFAISSGMTTKQLKEYIDGLHGEYLPMGVRLSIPEKSA